MRDARARATGLDHVSVTVADLEASVGFYGGLLGLELQGRGEADEPELAEMTGYPTARIAWAEFDLGGGRVLELVRFLEPTGVGSRGELRDPGRGHLGLRVRGIDALHEMLRRAGVVVRSAPVTLTEPGWEGVRAFYAEDPDGVVVELVERPS